MSPTLADSILLPDATLNGENGGLYDGSEWHSASLRNKVNLILYIDPDKQKQVKPLIAKLNSELSSTDSLGLFFIVNTSATMIPKFILRKKIANRAKSEKNTTYIFDHKRVLINKWNLADGEINIFLLDKTRHIFFNHTGRLSQEVIKTIIQTINDTLSKEDSNELTKN